MTAEIPYVTAERRPRPKSRLANVGDAAMQTIAYLTEENRRKDRIIKGQEYALKHDRFLKTMLHQEEFLNSFSEKIEKNKDRHIGLFFIDINRFKQFNDNNSHNDGDKLLKYFESRMSELFRRSSDELVVILPEEADQGRMGGDEFAVSMVFGENGDRNTDPTEQMDMLYARLKELEADIVLNFQHLMPENARLGLSIGSALYDPSNPLDAETLIEQADEAMYEEKPPKLPR